MTQRNFWEMYRQALEAQRADTPAQTFIAEVARVTGRTERTVRSWLYLQRLPDEATCEILAEHFGADVTTFFNPSEPSISGKNQETI